MLLAVFRRVFRYSRYRTVAIAVALGVLAVGVSLSNFGIIYQVIFSESISLGTKLSFIGGLFGSLATNFTILSAMYLVFVSMLFGINISLLVFYVRRRQEVTKNNKAHIASISGLISSILGIGCVACGSVVLTSTLAIFGAGWIVALLPLHGLEFSVIGIIFLAVSISYLAKKIDDPIVCPIKL
jgi:hypothetical protein